MQSFTSAALFLLTATVPPLLCDDAESPISPLSYLAKFGYIDSSAISVRGLDDDSEVLTNAVKDFQHFAGIDVTGKLDALTLELIQLPRCGVSDVNAIGDESRKRKRRYALEGSKWPRSNLTWAITKFPQKQTKVTDREVEETMERAMAMWGAVSDLQFVQVPPSQLDIDIVITFDAKAHGDDDPFDGQGGVLAHAYFPKYGGDMHVDDDENWTLGTTKGTNLLQAALHELGHSLGLSHSNVKESIMAPFYRGYDPDIALKEDDIQALRFLYGAKQGGANVAVPDVKPPPPTPPEADPEPNEICRDNFTLDAIFRTIDNTTYVFSGKKFWRLNQNGVDPGYPRSIGAVWPGLPHTIDAAFTWPTNNATYFFKDDKYWKFVNTVPQPGFPKDMSVGFPGIPPKIDAVFVWGGNGKIYFTKGNQFWKFDPDARPYVRSDKYPADLSVWGLTGPLSSVFQWDNGNTYFFKNKEYWRFDDISFKLATDDAHPFPRSTAFWWFNCTG